MRLWDTFDGATGKVLTKKVLTRKVLKALNIKNLAQRDWDSPPQALGIENVDLDRVARLLS